VNPSEPCDAFHLRGISHPSLKYTVPPGVCAFLPFENATGTCSLLNDSSEEVPAVATNAEGVAAITVCSDLSTVCYNVALTGLSGPITGAHFHGGAAGINGGVVLNLNNDVNGNRITGSADLTPQLLNAMSAVSLVRAFSFWP
jgi:hypothetical protein